MFDCWLRLLTLFLLLNPGAKSTFYSSKINYKQARAMADEYEVFIEASVRGYHAYFKDATVVIGEVLMCERELDNAYDKYAVAVNNEQGKVVGHMFP